jgi:hypothetical protein
MLLRRPAHLLAVLGPKLRGTKLRAALEAVAAAEMPAAEPTPEVAAAAARKSLGRETEG